MSGEKQVAVSGLNAGGSITIGKIHQVINSSNGFHQHVLQDYRLRIARLERNCLGKSKSNQLGLRQQIQELRRERKKNFENASKNFDDLKEMYGNGLEKLDEEREEKKNRRNPRRFESSSSSIIDGCSFLWTF